MQVIRASALASVALVSSMTLPAFIQTARPQPTEALNPLDYCEGAILKQSSGFFPYCSPIPHPRFGYSFTSLAAAAVRAGYLSEWRKEGSRTIPQRASKEEADLVNAVQSRVADGSNDQCLGQLLVHCIAALARRLVVTTNAALPFSPLSVARSFEPQADRSIANLQIILPGEGDRTIARTTGPGDRSPVRNVVGLTLSVQGGVVTSIEISGRYPILSTDPSAYEGTGFAAFMASVFPECRELDESAFYDVVWRNLVKPAAPSPDNGRWRFTDSGVAKGYTSVGSGTVCGLRAIAYSGVSNGFTDEGKRSGWAAKTLRISR